MKRVGVTTASCCLFLVVLSAFALPSFAFAENAMPYARYCPDPTDIFTGIAHETEYTPKITVKVDPVFESAMLKAHPSIPRLPLTPVYDIVVTAVPTINQYCLPQYDDRGQLIAPVTPPDILPFNGEIIIGNSPITKQGSIFVIGPGQFKLAGKTETGEWKYEWKLKGWPNGITKEVDMLRLFKAMNSEPREPINVRVEVKRPNKEVMFEITGAPFDNCSRLGSKKEIVWGRKKIITVQGFSVPSLDPFQSWMGKLVPGSVVTPGFSNMKKNTESLLSEAEIERQKGNHVLAVGHSFGSIVVFDSQKKFKPDACIDFMFLDPPYDSVAGFPLIAGTPFGKAVKAANDAVIKDNHYTIDWTKGRGLSHPFLHHPFMFRKFSKKSNANLKALETIIKDWQSSKQDWMPPKSKKTGVVQNQVILSAAALVGEGLAQSAGGQTLSQDDTSPNTPVIVRLSSVKGSIGSSLKISGLNFGTKVTVYLENDSGGFAWQEGLAVRKEEGQDTVTYTIPKEMLAVDETTYDAYIAKPLSVGLYSLSLSGSEETSFGSEPVSFEVTSGNITTLTPRLGADGKPLPVRKSEIPSSPGSEVRYGTASDCKEGVTAKGTFQYPSGIALSESGNPKMQIIVDPKFNDKMKAERGTPDLPVTPIYDLVVQAVPAFSSCYTDTPEKFSTEPPKELPFRAYIAVGQETLLFGSLVWYGKKDNQSRLLYEWKLDGWPSGIVSSEKLEKIIKAVQESDSSLRLGATINLPNRPIRQEETPTSFELCAPLSGGSPHSVVLMRGKSMEALASSMAQSEDKIRQNGFEAIQPFKKYSVFTENYARKSYFAHFIDLSEHDDTGWAMLSKKLFIAANSRPKNISACGPNASQYFFLTSRPQGGLNYAPYGGKIAFISTPTVEVAMHETAHSFAGLEDEYHFGFDLTLYNANCATASTRPGIPVPTTDSQKALLAKIEQAPRNSDLTFFKRAYWDTYGDTIKGCGVNSQFRPSLKSIMNTNGFNSDKFNIPSCVWILKAIKGTSSDADWQECMALDGLEKPTARSDGIISLSPPPFFSAWFQNQLAAIGAITDTVSSGSDTPFVNLEYFSPNGKEIKNEIYQRVSGNGENAVWQVVVAEQDDVIPATSQVAGTPPSEGTTCIAPNTAPKIITVGGVGSTYTHPFFAWVQGLGAVVGEIPLDGVSVEQASALLTSKINEQLTAGNRVVVVAHSLGSVIAFNLSTAFKGKPVEFIYIDPPYDSVGPVRCVASFCSETARAINLAFGHGIKDDPNIVDWTKGKSTDPLHDPWGSLKSGKVQEPPKKPLDIKGGELLGDLNRPGLTVEKNAELRRNLDDLTNKIQERLKCAEEKKFTPVDGEPYQGKAASSAQFSSGAKVKVSLSDDRTPPAEFSVLTTGEKATKPETCLDTSGQRVFATNPKPLQTSWGQEANCAQGISDATALYKRKAEIVASIATTQQYIDVAVSSLAEIKDMTTLDGVSFSLMSAGEKQEKGYDKVNGVTLQCVAGALTPLGTASSNKVETYSASSPAILKKVADLKQKQAVAKQAFLSEGEKEKGIVNNATLGRLTALKSALKEDFILVTSKAFAERQSSLGGAAAAIPLSVKLGRTSDGKAKQCTSFAFGVQTKLAIGGVKGTFLESTVAFGDQVFDRDCIPEAYLLGELKAGMESNVTYYKKLKEGYETLLHQTEPQLRALEAAKFNCVNPTILASGGTSVRKSTIPTRPEVAGEEGSEAYQGHAADSAQVGKIPDGEDIGVSCSGKVQEKTADGQYVLWQARAIGSNKGYTFTWSGTDALSGNGPTVRKVYAVGGWKRIRVEIVSGPKEASCDATVFVPDDSPALSTVELESNDVYVIEVDSAETDTRMHYFSSYFYEKYKRDDWDFLAFFSQFAPTSDSGNLYHINVKNDVKGIGLRLFDSTKRYGSEGRLWGIGILKNPDMYSGFPYDALLEEVFAHTMGVFVDNGSGALPVRNLLNPAHWSNCMSFPKEKNGHYDYWNAYTWQNNGDGTWTRTKGYSLESTRLDPFMLYLSGFLSPERVPDATLLKPLSGDTTECNRLSTIRATAQSISINDIIALHGPRVPSSKDSPKKFRTAFVLVVLKGSTPSSEMLKQLAAWSKSWPAVLAQAVDTSAFSASSVKSSIRISRGGEFNYPELPIGSLPQGLASFDIIASEAVRLSRLEFRISVTGNSSALSGMNSFGLYRLNPPGYIGYGKFGINRESVVFSNSIDIDAGVTTFALGAIPGSKFSPGQKLTLSANFYKDDIEATSKTDPKRYLNFSKSEVMINTLTAVLPNQGVKAPAQGNLPAEVLRAPAKVDKNGVNLSVTKPTISGSSAGEGKLYAGEMTLKASVMSEGLEVAQTFNNSLQYRDVATGGPWTDWVKFEVAGLNAGGRADVKQTWGGGVGEWEFRLVADNGNAVPESEEQDNQSGSVHVVIVPKAGESAVQPVEKATGPAKLLLSPPVISGQQVGFGKVRAGSMTISAKATNAGGGELPASEGLFQYSVDGRVWIDWVKSGVSTLGAGVSHTNVYDWEGGSGNWYFRFCVNEESLGRECSSNAFVEVVSN